MWKTNINTFFQLTFVCKYTVIVSNLTKFSNKVESNTARTKRQEK